MGCGGSKGATVVVQSHGVIQEGEAPTSQKVKGQTGQSDADYGRIEWKRSEVTKPDELTLQINKNQVVKSSQLDASPARVDVRKFTKSPFDPSVEVGKEPIPVFGEDAFPLSKGRRGLKIEDTFWAGKRAVIPDYNRMVELDKHAVQAPPSVRNDINKLVRYLTSIATSDLEKFRAIFRWTAHNIEYNVAFLETGVHGDNSKEGVLASGKAVCAGYSELILGMCQIAGIPCEKVSGHAKGSGYEPGMTDMRKMSHAWNRVTLGGQPFFSDCTWAAGSVNSKEGPVFSRHWKEPQFLAEPQRFTGTHIQHDLINQDCPSPYTSFDQWNNEPHLSLTTSFAGLRCLSHTEGVITTSDNTALIRFRLERAVFQSFCVLEGADGKRLVRAVVHWWDGNELSCHVTLPEAGTYTFMLNGRFSRRQNDDNETNNEVLYPSKADDVIDTRLVSYKIKATAKKGPKFESNAEHVHLFGAPLDLPDVGLVPAAKNQSVIKAPSGVARVVFKKVGSGPSTCQSELHGFDNKDKPLGSSIYCEQFGVWVVCHVRCPSTGLFSLSLYVTGHDGRKCFVRYTVASEGAVTPYQFPVIHGMAGPRVNFSEIGLCLADAISSTIVTDDGEGVLRVNWDTSRKMSLKVDLKDSSGSKSLHEEGHVIVETSPDPNGLQMLARIGIRVQNKGLYKLTLFAKEPDSSDHVFVGSWLVACNTSNTRELYPARTSVVGPREDFANLGLRTDVHSRVTCRGGVGVMEVRSEMKTMTRFLHNLTGTDKGEIKGHVFADTTVRDGERVTRFNFRIKQAGLFAFRLFANQNNSDANTYVGVWLIDCDVATKLPLFPGKYDSYGPNKNFREGGLQVDESASNRIELKGGEGQLSITHQPGTNRRVTVRLESKGSKYERSNVSTMLDSVWTTNGDVLSTTVRIRLKDTGLYDLVMFVEKGNGANKSDFAGAWLIDSIKATTKPLFPETQGSIGPSARFFAMGLTADGQLPSVLRATKAGMCILSVKRNKPFKTLFKGSKDGMNINEEWRKEGEKHIVTCSVQLPRKGLYALQMFACEPSASSKDSTGNWLLEWEVDT